MEHWNDRKDDFCFHQVVVWPHTLLDGDIEGFTKFIHETFDGTRISDLIEYKVNDERTDVVFRIHAADIPKFAVPRLQYGMRWLEDVMNNNSEYRPPEGYERTW